jgi:hypothetical protein
MMHMQSLLFEIIMMIAGTDLPPTGEQIGRPTRAKRGNMTHIQPLLLDIVTILALEDVT